MIEANYGAGLAQQQQIVLKEPAEPPKKELVYSG